MGSYFSARMFKKKCVNYREPVCIHTYDHYSLLVENGSLHFIGEYSFRGFFSISGCSVLCMEDTYCTSSYDSCKLQLHPFCRKLQICILSRYDKKWINSRSNFHFIYSIYRLHEYLNIRLPELETSTLALLTHSDFILYASVRH